MIAKIVNSQNVKLKTCVEKPQGVTSLYSACKEFVQGDSLTATLIMGLGNYFFDSRSLCGVCGVVL